VVCWLRDERGLLVNNPDAPIRPCRGELNALGHHIRRDRVAPLPRAVRRLRARLRELVRRRAPRWRVGMNRSIVSSVGLLRFGA
jgi:hypothetical protein